VQGKGIGGGGQFTYQSDLETNICWSKRNSKNSTMDLDGFQKAIVGRASQFGWLIYCSLNSSTTRLVGGVFAHLRIHERWRH